MAKKAFLFDHTCNLRLTVEKFNYNSTWDQKDEYAQRLGYKSAVDAIGTKEFSSAFPFNNAFKEYTKAIDELFNATKHTKRKTGSPQLNN